MDRMAQFIQFMTPKLYPTISSLGVEYRCTSSAETNAIPGAWVEITFLFRHIALFLPSLFWRILCRTLTLGDSMDAFFNIEFSRSLVTTFVGASLAIGAAFFLRYIAQKDSRKSLADRGKQLANILGPKIKSNIEIAKEFTDIEDTHAPSGVNIDLALLDSTRSLKYELLNDDELCWDIDQLAYNLAMLNQAIANGVAITLSGSFRALTGTQELRSGVFRHIRSAATESIEYESSKEIVSRLNQLAGLATASGLNSTNRS